MSTPGKVENRETFLKHLTEKLGRKEMRQNVQLPEWEAQPQYKILKDASPEELVEVFKAAAAKINTPVLETTISDLPSTLKEAIVQLNGKSVATWADPRFDDYNLKQALEEFSLHTWDSYSAEKNIIETRDADVGITFSDYTLAESATVVLTTSPEKGRSVSLLPESFIALVPKSTIVPRLTQVTDKIDEEIKNGSEVSSCIKFISGPSNSADIELSFVTGVHGPVHAAYIIINDC
ncbi:LutC/YkgG family protein [Pseudalkalibacillus caeni]|uniref:Lactate utilization protein C n=1 Tax=Exobacillus caeni TaxID=2574798 RepID=A0A5R9F923_9BACL|nr:lactate utilization protein C [Pseudalkalibacillus caeni]TLS36205.1 lactate utilization protein C [Pseudalkalibacillus caeni]